MIDTAALFSGLTFIEFTVINCQAERICIYGSAMTVISNLIVSVKDDLVKHDLVNAGRCNHRRTCLILGQCTLFVNAVDCETVDICIVKVKAAFQSVAFVSVVEQFNYNVSVQRIRIVECTFQWLPIVVA